TARRLRYPCDDSTAHGLLPSNLGRQDTRTTAVGSRLGWGWGDSCRECAFSSAFVRSSANSYCKVTFAAALWYVCIDFAAARLRDGRRLISSHQAPLPHDELRSAAGPCRVRNAYVIAVFGEGPEPPQPQCFV